MIVVKFGGTSLAGTERLRAAARIVAALRAEQPVVCVVSAMSGVTDTLLTIADLMMKKSETQAQTLLTALIQQHEQVTRSLTTTRSSAVTTAGSVAETTPSLAAGYAALRADLERLAALRERPDDHETQHALAAFSGWGERLSVHLFALALAAEGIAAAPCTGEPVVMVDLTPGPSPIGEGRTGVPCSPLPRTGEGLGVGLPSWEQLRPSVAATREWLAPEIATQLAAGCVPVLPGYLARTAEGLVTTLGRNGSDYSAALIAAALGAGRLHLYSDVAGVHRADPRAVPDAALLSALSYADAAEMSAMGARVLHPQTLRPLAAAGIPLYLHSSFVPETPGTVIGTPAMIQADAVHDTPFDTSLTRPAWVVIARSVTSAHPLFGYLQHAGDTDDQADGLVEVTGLFLRHADLPAQEDDHLHTYFAALHQSPADAVSGYPCYPGDGAVSGALALLAGTPRPLRLALSARYISVAVPMAESAATQRRLYHALLHADERAILNMPQAADEPAHGLAERRRSS